MSPHPMQYASLVYFSLPDEYFREELRDRYKSRVDLLATALAKVGFGVVQPEGTYYLFVKYRGVEQLKDLSPMESAMHMIEKVGVATVPGDNFYGKSTDGEDYLRFAACRSNEDIKNAIELLNRYLSPNKEYKYNNTEYSASISVTHQLLLYLKSSRVLYHLLHYQSFAQMLQLKEVLDWMLLYLILFRHLLSNTRVQRLVHHSLSY